MREKSLQLVSTCSQIAVRYRVHCCRQLYIKQVASTVSIKVVQEFLLVVFATAVRVPLLDHRRPKLQTERCVIVASSYKKLNGLEPRRNQNGVVLGLALNK